MAPVYLVFFFCRPRLRYYNSNLLGKMCKRRHEFSVMAKIYKHTLGKALSFIVSLITVYVFRFFLQVVSYYCLCSTQCLEQRSVGWILTVLPTAKYIQSVGRGCLQDLFDRMMWDIFCRTRLVDVCFCLNSHYFHIGDGHQPNNGWLI